MSISQSELSYIQESLRQDYRLDGRSRLDWRPLSIARGVAASANGSARCRLGGTDVLAACRLEVEEVSQGSLECFVECTPAALAVLTTDVSFSLTSHLRALFTRTIAGDAQLAILPGSRAWVISLDLTILSADGGNLIDAASCAARCALADLRIPRTRAVGYASAKSSEGKSADGMASLLKSGVAASSRATKARGRAADFELESYWEAGDPFKCAENLPVAVTINLIDDLWFVDATLQEEQSCPSRLILGIDANHKIRLIRQEGELEIESDRLETLIDSTASLASELMTALRNASE